MTELNIIGSILSGFTYGSHEVKNVVVPSGVKKISRLAFCNSIIESIFIPEGVTHIGTEAFKGCTLLTDISIPKSVTNLGEDVFSDTPWFKNLYEYFSIIGDGFLIKYNGKDTNVIIPDTVKQIYFNAFFTKSIESIEIPDSVINIHHGAFGYCRLLKQLTIPDSVQKIGSHAFMNCYSLKSITLSKKLTQIPSFAFYGCLSLKQITIPKGVTQIDSCAFGRCSNLEQVDIPHSVVEIGLNAFEKCFSLQKIYIPNSAMISHNHIFFQCKSMKEITIYNNTFDCQSWELDYFVPNDVRMLLLYDDYSTQIHPSIKNPLVYWLYFDKLKTTAESYIRQNTVDVISHFINSNDYDKVRRLFECGKFVSQSNIMDLVEATILNTQNDGDVSIQLFIMDYKNKFFPDTDLFDNLLM